MNETGALVLTAATIGFVHTLLGPDHYLPFISLSKARGWSVVKTLSITILCGVGHVLGSVVLGLIGIGFGLAVAGLELFETIRGDFAAYAMIAFGIIYLSWGLKRAFSKKYHRHSHENKKGGLTLWVLFIVFVLGPCEPLIPILMYPAAQYSLSGLLLVTLVFSLTTITTMTVIVYLVTKGISFTRFHQLERYSHSLAGFVITLCGVAIVLGL